MTTTHKINIAGLILVPLIIAAGYWYFTESATPLINQEANENSSSPITQIANVNQVAEFSLKDKKVMFQDNEHQAVLTFILNGQIIPANVCFNIKSNAKILDLNFEGPSRVTKKDVSSGTICLASPYSELILWVKFEKEPTQLNGTATNL